MRRGNWMAVAFGLTAVLVAGCDRTPDADNDMREAGREVGAAADRTGDAVEDAAHDVASVTDAAQQTAQIKTAFIADDMIDASNIDVDTSADTKTVTLKGSVPTAAQKEAAERVAREKAPGYTVDNQLAVRSE
jgi:osmotically-inducible protein OsmY